MWFGGGAMRGYERFPVGILLGMSMRIRRSAGAHLACQGTGVWALNPGSDR